MTFPILPSNSQTGYFLQRSLRFRASASAYLNRTPASSSNRRTYTWSGWVKRGKLGSSQGLFEAVLNSTTITSLYFNSSDQLTLQMYQDPSYNSLWTSNAVFRDPSAWYHILFAIDTTQSTNAAMLKLYVNGVLQTTPYVIAQYSAIPQNYDTIIDYTTAHSLGRYSGANYFDGYMAEVNFIDGQALTPSSFGSTNSTTGVWQPAAYTGTYGTNGFYLPFTDNSALTTSSNVGLGKDFSGNGNYWTTNNISITAGATYDSMTDVPTLTSATAANYCTFNPLNSNTTLSSGNLSSTPASTQCGVAGTMTIDVNSYFEWDTFLASGIGIHVGIIQASPTNGQLSTTANSDSVIYRKDGAIFRNTGSGFTQVQTVASYGATTDVIACAVSKTGNTIQFYKNNAAVGTAISLTSTVNYMPWLTYGGTGGGCSVNFGQRPFTYTPPSGFVALNTYNLPDSTIKQGNKVMDATLYTGNGSTQTITNAASFKPDLVWYKGRNVAYNNSLFDSVRGATKQLVSNTTDAEATLSGLTAFNSNGFSLGSASNGNNNADTYVAWQWQAGQGSSSSNTSGTITSQVSVNASAGFSVVTYTGVALAGTVGHGLGVAPQFIVVKPRSATITTDSWNIYHSALGNTQFLVLNATDAASTSSTRWNNTSPTSSVFSIGITPSSVAVGYVAYCWSEIAGYSKFGSYTGNGSADGTFVYLGFRPKFILIKRIDTTGNNWRIWDTARASYNLGIISLFPNVPDVEDSVSDAYDLLSNGFKIRSSGGGTNASGGTYMYACFAENPFRNALAR